MKKQTAPKSLIPILLILGGILLVVSAVLLAMQNTSAVPASTPAHEEETFPEIPRVSITQAKTALDADAAVFVDVRSLEAYQASHIAGAINIPLTELESQLGTLDKNEWIITYCT